MPIYEYRCTRCGAETEAIQRMSDPPLRRCTTCKGRLEKLVSQTSFQLKGSGWYMTDYGGKRGQKQKDPDRGKDSKTAA